MRANYFERAFTEVLPNVDMSKWWDSFQTVDEDNINYIHERIKSANIYNYVFDGLRSGTKNNCVDVLALQSDKHNFFCIWCKVEL